MIYKLKLKHKEKLNIKWMCEIARVLIVTLYDAEKVNNCINKIMG